jgi:RNA polymerase sigma-70 factor (ECF subfamily)
MTHNRWIERLPEAIQANASDEEKARLVECIEEALEKWDSLSHPTEMFLDDLVQKAPTDIALGSWLGSLQIPDLFLASACAYGNRTAIDAFEEMYFGEVDAALLDAKVAADQIDEIKQILRERFFVGKGDRPPSITGYSGRGTLRAWVRISAMREVYRAGGAQKRWVQLEDEGLARVAALDDDPELGFLKKRYRAVFKEAFGEAMAELTPRQRNVLRHSYIDNMSIDQIGQLYNVHRSTTARWLVQTRELLLEGTRRVLRSRLNMSSDESQDLFRLIESRLDVSIRTLLKTR